MTRTCSACVSTAGPVSTYLAPACPSSMSARAATAATSRSWINDRPALHLAPHAVGSGVPVVAYRHCRHVDDPLGVLGHQANDGGRRVGDQERPEQEHRLHIVQRTGHTGQVGEVAVDQLDARRYGGRIGLACHSPYGCTRGVQSDTTCPPMEPVAPVTRIRLC